MGEAFKDDVEDVTLWNRVRFPALTPRAIRHWRLIMSHRQKYAVSPKRLYYGKDHIHQPARGKGAYSREDLPPSNRLTEEELNDIIEAGLDDVLRATRPYGVLSDD